MSMAGSKGPDSFPLTLAERVDRACDAFESAWRSGRQPRIETYLAEAAESERPALLHELLIGELELRLGSGETPSREEYEVRFPGYTAVLALVFVGVETPDGLKLDVTAGSPRHGEGRPEAAAFIGDREASAPGASAPTVTAVLQQEFGMGAAGFPKRKRPAAPSFPVKPSIPGFEILKELGRGGMGVVYLARELRLNRPCALKMIRAGNLAGARETRRFLAEAEAAARLRHPNIVQVFSLGECDGLPYLELEYVEGGSLADQLDGTPRPPHDATRLVETLARCIGAAHALGIVHRDLKPANVLLSADGIPKITDFGLARAMDSDSGLTASEEILGTPSYMAPEQAGGKSKQAGPAADVYALGAVLYELLTGRPPFKAATVLETLEQVRSTEPVPPSRLVPRLPRDLETICLKCLQKASSARYESAARLAADLTRYLEGQPIEARPIGRAHRLWRWCRRNKAVAVLTASVATLLVASTIVAGLAAYQSHRGYLRERGLGQVADDARGRAEANRIRAEANLVRARAVVERDVHRSRRRSDRPERNGAVPAETAREGPGLLRGNRPAAEQRPGRAVRGRQGCPAGGRHPGQAWPVDDRSGNPWSGLGRARAADCRSSW